MDVEKQEAPRVAGPYLPGLREHCHREVDIDGYSVALPLALYCVTAGFVGAIVFSATWIWCPFQTGNTAQIGIALGRMISEGSDISPQSFHISDAQALTSLLSFFSGGLLNHLIPRRISRKTRAYLALATLAQAVLTALACVMNYCAHESSFAPSRTQPSWTSPFGFATLALLSASFGFQGVVSDQLGTPFGVSVVLTSLWVQTSYQPLTLWRRYDKRDQKVLAIVAMFAGAIAGRSLVGQLGDYGSLATAAGLRGTTAVIWLVVPAKKSFLPRVESQRTLVDPPTLRPYKNALKKSQSHLTSPSMYLQDSRDSTRTFAA